MALDDVDLFVYHQANTRILDAVGRELGLDPERVVDCIAHYGNTSAATIPIALRVAADAGRLEPGARVLLGAFGAGFTWGAAVIEWGAEHDRGLRPGHRRLARHRRRQRPRAGRRRLARGRELPLRRGRRERDRVRHRGGGRPRRGHPGRRGRPRLRRRPVRRRRGAPGPGDGAGQQRRRDGRQPVAPDRRRGLGLGDRHQPVGRVPPDPPRPAADDEGALRPRGQRGVGHRPAGQPGPGQLRRVQGRA